MLLVMFVLLVSFSSKPQTFVRNWTPTRWSFNEGDDCGFVGHACDVQVFPNNLGSSQGKDPDQANRVLSGEKILMLLVMFVLLVSFSSKPQTFEGNWTWPGERWSGLVGDLAVEPGDDFDLGDAVLIVFGGVISLVLVLVLERHIQVVSESDHNNLIIISSLRSESDHLQCLIRSHFRSCSGDLKPAEEKQDEPVYVQVKKDDNRSAYDRKKTSFSSYS